MAKGGWTGMHNFRKIHSDKAIKSKYASIVKTKEDLEKEDQDNENQMQDDSSDEEEAPKQVA